MRQIIEHKTSSWPRVASCWLCDTDKLLVNICNRNTDSQGDNNTKMILRVGVYLACILNQWICLTLQEARTLWSLFKSWLSDNILIGHPVSMSQIINPKMWSRLNLIHIQSDIVTVNSQYCLSYASLLEFILFSLLLQTECEELYTDWYDKEHSLRVWAKARPG